MNKSFLVFRFLGNYLLYSSEGASYCPKGFVDREDADCIIRPGHWRKEIYNTTTNNPKTNLSSNNSSQTNFALTDRFMHYFMNEGAINKQNKIV